MALYQKITITLPNNTTKKKQIDGHNMKHNQSH